ncbi:type IV pilus biogenesis/stability protein PilW [Alteromonas sp. S167]|uniref:type IV pilus biogenesis/stability protein PilW n=1 Tax=Alteromonas sp. S167 TaxID=3117402 RepID=UPI002FE0B613
MRTGLRSSLRICLLGAALAASGCVSNNQAGSYGSNFDREEAAKTRMSLGLTYLQNNNYSQAKKNLDKALAFDPRSADVQYAMAYYYQLVGDNQRAEEFYEAAIDLAPNNGDIANSYGAFKCQNGQYEDAKAYFFDAINNRLYANAAQTYENLALCAQSQGNLEEATNYFKEALKHQPARAKSLYLLTQLYTVSEQWDLAKQTSKQYEKVARVSPDSLWLAYEIAKGQGDLETAKGYGEMMQSLFPDNPLTARFEKESASSPNRIVKVVKNSDNAAPSKTTAMDKSVPEVKSAQPKASDTGIERTVRQASTNTENAASVNAQASKTSIAKAQSNKLSAETPKIHVVKPGENLYRISLLHNIKMATLQEWNNLGNTGAIIAGQSLWLVPPSMQEE